MNIANYITDSATAAQRLTAEAPLPPLRGVKSRAQALLNHIADTGPVSTADLCKALNITNRQAWGMLKYPLQTGKVIHDRGMWARTAKEVVDWQAAIDEAALAAQEADAVALLTRRGWTCVGQTVVPEGWKLVPVEPTSRMLEEAQKAWLSDPCRRTSTLYKAMIAASEKGSGDADN